MKGQRERDRETKQIYRRAGDGAIEGDRQRGRERDRVNKA